MSDSEDQVMEDNIDNNLGQELTKAFTYILEKYPDTYIEILRRGVGDKEYNTKGLREQRQLKITINRPIHKNDKFN